MLDDEPPLLPEGNEDGEEDPPDDPEGLELPLGDELGTGMPGGVGCDTVASVRQPDSSVAASAAAAVRILRSSLIQLASDGGPPGAPASPAAGPDDISTWRTRRGSAPP